METVLAWYESECGVGTTRLSASASRLSASASRLSASASRLSASASRLSASRLPSSDVRDAFVAHVWDALTECERVLCGVVFVSDTRQKRALRVLHVVSVLAGVYDFPRADDVRRRVAQLEYDISPMLHEYEITCDFARACDVYSRLPRKRNVWEMMWGDE